MNDKLFLAVGLAVICLLSWALVALVDPAPSPPCTMIFFGKGFICV